jgi:putative transposase
MRLAQSPNSDDSVALLQDITRDKTGIAQAPGCTSTWHHHGGLQAVLTDLGAAFVDDNFRTAVLDAHGNPETPPGGLPQLRSRVERIFGTFGTSLMPYLGGRTFSSPKERGDYPSVQSAALSDDVLMQILVIFVVDVYHNRPHQGLRGETPNNCWKRLSQEKGVAPALSERSRRIAFGLKDRRRVSGRGVRKFGIDYTCRALRQFHPHSLEKDVDIRVDLHDLGWIMVRIGGEWHVAHALQKCFGGVSYDHWSAVARHLRQKHHEEAVLQERTIAEALKRIIEINAREEWRLKAILHALTPAGLRRAKEDLFLGLSIEPESEIDLPPDDDLFGRSIPHDGEGASDRPAKEDPDKPTGDNSNTWEFDGDE